MKRIVVKFYGFSDAERHALDTVFRLSESHETVYSAWTPQTGEASQSPDLLMIDGSSWEAVLELANPAHDVPKLIWVGEDAPATAWRVFPAPVKWSAVVEVLDAEFAPLTSHTISADLDSVHGEDLNVLLDDPSDDTQPLALDDATGVPRRRVLVVDAGRDDRLYLRAKLAAAELHDVDEASCGAEALALLSTHTYQLVTVDLGLSDMDSWQLIKAVQVTRPAIAHLFITGATLAWHQRCRAWFAGAQASLKKPLHPGQLRKLLQKM